jgi:hypothetical protein
VTSLSLMGRRATCWTFVAPYLTAPEEHLFLTLRHLLFGRYKRFLKRSVSPFLDIGKTEFHWNCVRFVLQGFLGSVFPKLSKAVPLVINVSPNL